jgi:putative NADH-flavin reductase
MKVILFGASGMVGQGVLRECLLDPEVERVLAVVRSPMGQHHEKLHEIVHADFYDFSAIEEELYGYDACLFCLGVSSAGHGDTKNQQRKKKSVPRGKREPAETSRFVSACSLFLR